MSEQNNSLTVSLKSPLIKSDIKLTIGILVSNQIKYIRQCLDSVVPILKAIPSELVIVDTVGPEKSDGSLAIATEYTDRIIHFDWCNDFAQARNVSVDNARGEWFMFIDDDEWIDDPTELIDFFKTGECERFLTGVFKVRNFRANATPVSSVGGRLFRRTETGRFQGRVHESFNEMYQPAKMFRSYLNHMGYYFQTIEDRFKKSQRNIVLLEAQLKEEGNSPTACAQYIQEMMNVDSKDAPLKCLEFINDLKKQGEEMNNCVQWMIVALLRDLTERNDIEAFLRRENEIRQDYKLSEVVELVIRYLKVTEFIRIEAWKETLDNAKEYFELFDWFESHESAKVLQLQLDLPRFLEAEVPFCVAKDGMIAANKLGRYQESYELVRRLDFSHALAPAEDRKLVEATLRNLNDREKACKYYKGIYRDEYFSNPKLRKFLPGSCR